MRKNEKALKISLNFKEAANKSLTKQRDNLSDQLAQRDQNDPQS